MGTVGEWLEVVAAAAFWGGGMLLFDSVTRNAETRSRSQWANVLGTALGSLLFGLLAAFGFRRTFQFPLLLLSGGIILAALVAMVLRKRTVRREVR
jgi:drug/metabolite transporter (DMT)-like permease